MSLTVAPGHTVGCHWGGPDPWRDLPVFGPVAYREDRRYTCTCGLDTRDQAEIRAHADAVARPHRAGSVRGDPATADDG